MFVIRRGTDPQDTTIENANMVVTATMADMNVMVIGTEIGIGIVMSPAVMTENAIGIVMEAGVDAKSMMNTHADDMMMNEDGSADLVTRRMVEEVERGESYVRFGIYVAVGRKKGVDKRDVDGV